MLSDGRAGVDRHAGSALKNANHLILGFFQALFVSQPSPALTCSWRAGAGVLMERMEGMAAETARGG